MTPILPLVKKIKKKIHRDIAQAQDIIVIEMYNIFQSAIIHGGTSIWRCYSGNRFSEDIDVYLPVKYKHSAELSTFKENLNKVGFVIEKFKQTRNSLFSKFSIQKSVVRFEVVFKDIKHFVTKTFELSDGSFMNVYTLSPEDIIKEKVLAYLKRRKIRDLYDIYFMLNFVEDKKKILESLKKLVDDFQKPVDEKELKALIIYGAVPRVNDMMMVINRWVK